MAAAAATTTCDGVCQLYNGQAHFAADTRFHVSGNMQGDEESSTVYFNQQITTIAG